MLEIPVDLNALLSVSTVECVHVLEASSLQTLLKWIVECLQRQDNENETVRETIHQNAEALRRLENQTEGLLQQNEALGNVQVSVV